MTLPVPPAELTAELTVDSGSPGVDRPALDAARSAAARSGLARDAGPATTALSGAKEEVLDALRGALDAALAAGAVTVDVRLQVSRSVRRPV